MSNTYFSRSGAIPLSLDFDLSNAITDSNIDSYDTNSYLTSLIISSIFPHATRWAHLSLAAPLQGVLPIFQFLKSKIPRLLTTLILDLSCTPLIMPHEADIQQEMIPNQLEVENHNRLAIPLSLAGLDNLESLTMYGNSDPRVLFNWDLNVFPPSVKKIMLWNVRIQCKAPPLRQQCSNALQTLRLRSSLSLDNLLSILSSCIELEELTLDARISGSNMRQIDASVLQRKGIFMPKLKMLRLCVNETTTEFLDYLITPSLQTLDFSLDASSSGIEALRHLNYYLSRSQPKITTLILHDDTDMGEDDVIRLLHQFPHLEELRLLKQNLGDHILSALTLCREHARNVSSHGDSRPSLCPSLNRITFSSGNEFSSQCIIDFIKSRYVFIYFIS